MNTAKNAARHHLTVWRPDEDGGLRSELERLRLIRQIGERKTCDRIPQDKRTPSSDKVGPGLDHRLFPGSEKIVSCEIGVDSFGVPSARFQTCAVFVKAFQATK